MEVVFGLLPFHRERSQIVLSFAQAGKLKSKPKFSQMTIGWSQIGLLEWSDAASACARSAGRYVLEPDTSSPFGVC